VEVAPAAEAGGAAAGAALLQPALNPTHRNQLAELRDSFIPSTLHLQKPSTTI
jgi:hypothetical protein